MSSLWARLRWWGGAWPGVWPVESPPQGRSRATSKGVRWDPPCSFIRTQSPPAEDCSGQPLSAEHRSVVVHFYWAAQWSVCTVPPLHHLFHFMVIVYFLLNNIYTLPLFPFLSLDPTYQWPLFCLATVCYRVLTTSEMSKVTKQNWVFNQTM